MKKRRFSQEEDDMEEGEIPPEIGSNFSDFRCFQKKFLLASGKKLAILYCNLYNTIIEETSKGQNIPGIFPERRKPRFPVKTEAPEAFVVEHADEPPAAKRAV